MSKFLKFITYASLSIVLIGCSGSTESSPATQAPNPSTTIPTAIPTDIPATTAPAEPLAEPTIIRVGVQTNTIYPLVIIDGDVYDGFEIDLTKEIVMRIYGENSQIQWVPISSADRFTSLASGQIEFLVRNVLHTNSREELALFSGGYLLSGNGFLTMASAGFETPSDLDGLQIALPGFYQETLDSLAGNLGVVFVQNIIDNNEDFINSLNSDEVQAIFHDWVLLVTIKENDSQIIFLDDTSLAPFGIALPLSSDELRDQVDIALGEIISDGTWLSLFDKWFAMDLPWNIDEMFTYPPANR